MARGNTPKLKDTDTAPVIAEYLKHWFTRLLHAAVSGSLAGQEAEFASHKTSRDYLLNMIGTTSFGVVFPLLTIIVTQLVGVEQAGMFALAFCIASLLLVVSNYGMRTYQISDIHEEHSFGDYQLSRVVTCGFMVIAAAIYCLARHYTDEMLTISIGVYGYKMIDGLADVYEGRLQQVDKLYLAGGSQTLRSVSVLVVFSLFLLISRDLAMSCIAMFVTAALTLIFFTLPLAKFESPKSNGVEFENIIHLITTCAPLFAALFLYTIIDYLPVLVMEGVLSYDNQLYYNALYFPAQAVLLIMGMFYKPLLVKIANVWADQSMRRRFDLITLGIFCVIFVFTLFMVGIMDWIGIGILSFLYGVDFEEFRPISYIFIIAGGVTACIDFLYQIITVLRRQHTVTKLYLIAFAFALFITPLQVNFTGLKGAIIGYLIVMCILCVLLAWQYISIRIEFFKHPEQINALSGKDIGEPEWEFQEDERARKSALQKWQRP